GALIASGTYTIELNNTTLKAGRRLVVAKFPVRPVITKQISLAIEDATAVWDTISYSTPSSEELSQFPNQSLPRDSGTYQPQGNPQEYIILNVTFGALPGGGAVQQARSVIGFEIYGTWTTTTAAVGAGSFVRVKLGSTVLFERNATNITWWPSTIYYPQGTSYFTGWNFTLQHVLSTTSPYTIGLRVTSH